MSSNLNYGHVIDSEVSDSLRVMWVALITILTLLDCKHGLLFSTYGALLSIMRWVLYRKLHNESIAILVRVQYGEVLHSHAGTGISLAFGSGKIPNVHTCAIYFTMLHSHLCNDVLPNPYWILKSLIIKSPMEGHGRRGRMARHCIQAK